VSVNIVEYVIHGSEAIKKLEESIYSIAFFRILSK